MNKAMLVAGVGLVVGLFALAGCAGGAITESTEGATGRSVPGDGGAQTSFTPEQIALANDAVQDLRNDMGSGQAVMTVTSYAKYIAALEADTVRTSPALSDTDNVVVVVVAVDGSINTASIKWAPDAGPIPEARGTVFGVDESGRFVSRLVLFEPSQSSKDSTEYDPQGAVERLTDLGAEVLVLN